METYTLVGRDGWKADIAGGVDYVVCLWHLRRSDVRVFVDRADLCRHTAEPQEMR